MYLAYRVQCKISSDYTNVIQDFIDNGYEFSTVVTSEPNNSFIVKWQEFLRDNGYCLIDFIHETDPCKKIQMYNECKHSHLDITGALSKDIVCYYRYIPLNGLPSRWGNDCTINENTFTFSGEIKDPDAFIYFLKYVLTHLSNEITTCWTCWEDSDDVIKHSDYDIRHGHIII